MQTCNIYTLNVQLVAYTYSQWEVNISTYCFMIHKNITKSIIKLITMWEFNSP